MRSLNRPRRAPRLKAGLLALALAATLAAGLALLPATAARAQTSDAPRIRNLTAAGVISIDSFHFISGATNDMDVDVCGVTSTGSLDENDCRRSSFTLSVAGYQAFDITNNANWPAGGGGGRQVRAKTYTSNGGNSYESPWSPSRRWIGANNNCTETNSPPINLGELDVADGSTLTRSGTVEGAYYQAPCKDTDTGNASVYFRFTIAAGAAGAARIAAPRGQSTMIPDLLLRSGAAYTGSTVWQDDYHQARDDALAAGLLDAGTYTLQLRAATQRLTSSNPAAAGGTYTVTITRLQPELTSLTPAPTYLDSIWDVGAPVAASRHGRSDNSIELPIQIDYQEISAADWTSVETSVSPDDGSSTVLTRASNLELGSEYRMRAAYTNADSYTVSDNATTKAFIRISSAPYRVEALSDLIDAPNRKYRVRVAWESPEIEVDDNLTYRYATRLNSSDAMSNPIGQEQVLETVFDYSAAGGELLQIEVNNTFSCLQPDGNQWTECQLSYDGRDYVIPAGDGWSTPWSAPAFVNLSARTAAASGRGTDRAPHESVTQALALGFDTAGVPEEERPIETLAVALGTIFALAIGSTVGYMSKGPKTSRVALGAIIFFALLAGVATVMFGVPEALVMVLATSIIILAIAFLIRRFAV